MRKRKGMEAYLAVPIGLAFIIIVAFALKGLSNYNIIQSHILVQQSFEFESSFGNLVGEVNQLLTVKNNSYFPGNLTTFDKKIDKLSYWLAFYAHANETNSNLKLNVTNPNSEEVSLSDVNISLNKQLNTTAHSLLANDIFYSLVFYDLIVNQIPDRKIQSFGRAILPIPVPGGTIDYFKFGREETDYNIILAQEEEPDD